jgi:acyl carrier protein phosphodiesterase
LREQYSDLPYDDFSRMTYARIRKELPIAPPEIAARLERMVEHDWLKSYTTKEGMEYVFSRLSERTQSKRDFSNAVSLLYEHMEDYNLEFNLFFPQLLKACELVP